MKPMRKLLFPLLVVTAAMFAVAPILIARAPYESTMLMVQKIFDTIRAIAATGVTTFLVEQNAKLALELCDRGYVMESGEIILHDRARALLANPQVRRAYLGEEGLMNG